MKQIIKLTPWRAQRYWELAKDIGRQIVEEKRKENEKQQSLKLQ